MRRSKTGLVLLILSLLGAGCVEGEVTEATTAAEAKGCGHHRCAKDSGVVSAPDSGIAADSGVVSTPDSGVVSTPDSGVVSTPDSGAAPSDSGVPAIGISVDGFPSWAERLQLEWMNRARSDPQVEMSACGANCGEAACYTPQPPLRNGPQLNHAARFNSSFIGHNAYFAHNTPCTLVSNLASIYPQPCDGLASCSCAEGMISSTASTDPWTRIALFGGSGSGEIIAGGGDPSSGFYLWLFEGSSSTSCSFSFSNGHRWLLLTSAGPDVGFGANGGGIYTGDFGNGGGGPAWKIPSGSHYPRSGASVDLWANWYDTAAPASAQVDIDGVCSSMTLSRGTGTNGAWKTTAAGLSGCHRYFFSFKDSAGNVITYPTVGSLGIGDASCADWDNSRPPACP